MYIPVAVWPNFSEVRFCSGLKLCWVGEVEEVDVLKEWNCWTLKLLERGTAWLNHHSL